MEICSNHGSEIAYTGRDCPACEEIEDLNRDHNEQIASLIEDHETQMTELEDKIYDLENK